MSSDALTVWVIDDDQDLRDAVASLLVSAGYRVETYPNAEAFIARADASRPGCLVVDLVMPGLSGMDLMNWLLDRNISNTIIFLTGHGSTRIAVDMMKAGAFDFLEKPVSGKVLLAAVERALERSVALARRQSRRDEYLERLASLTSREREVLELVIQGHYNKVVADRLNISSKTVEVHRRRVMSKMQAGSLPELVQMAMVCGIRVLDVPSSEAG